MSWHEDQSDIYKFVQFSSLCSIDWICLTIINSQAKSNLLQEVFGLHIRFPCTWEKLIIILIAPDRHHMNHACSFLHGFCKYLAGSGRIRETGFWQHWYPCALTCQWAGGTVLLVVMLSVDHSFWYFTSKHLLNRWPSLCWRHPEKAILRQYLHQVTPTFLYSSVSFL